jgi:hypothetical protein
MAGFGPEIEFWDTATWRQLFAFRPPTRATSNNEIYPAGWAEDSRHFLFDVGGPVWVIRAGK